MNEVTDAVAEWGDNPLVYGSTDCCQFADFVVHKLTGKHYIPWAYESEYQAAKILAKHGGLGGAVTFAMGREPVAPDEFELGAVTELEAKTQAIGIYVGFGVVAALDDEGSLVVAPISQALRGWNL